MTCHEHSLAQICVSVDADEKIVPIEMPLIKFMKTIINMQSEQCQRKHPQFKEKVKYEEKTIEVNDVRITGKMFPCYVDGRISFYLAPGSNSDLCMSFMKQRRRIIFGQ